MSELSIKTNQSDLYAPLDDSDFVPPASLREAQEHMLVLREEIGQIDIQLTNRNRTKADGERVDGHEYWTWRHKAIAAKTYKIERLRRLKAWATAEIERQKQARPGTRERKVFAAEVADDPDALLRLAYAVLARCVNDEEIIFTNREQDTFETIKAYIKRHKRTFSA